MWKWLAWRLPKRLVYWAAIRLIAFATQGSYSNQIVPDLGAMEALKRWEWAEHGRAALGREECWRT